MDSWLVAFVIGIFLGVTFGVVTAGLIGGANDYE